MKISKETIIRTVLLILALVNQVLALLGKNPIPVLEEDVYNLLSLLFTIGTSIWSWWKNNSITSNAIKADKYLKELKNGMEK